MTFSLLQLTNNFRIFWLRENEAKMAQKRIILASEVKFFSFFFEMKQKKEIELKQKFYNKNLVQNYDNFD